MRELDPRDHIDRAAEQELFSTLVACNTRARILSICDRGGRGKSSLLKRLKYNCQYAIKPPVPVSLVELDQVDPSPFAFALKMVEGLKPPGGDVAGDDVTQKFAKFIPLEAARQKKDFTPFEDGSGPIRATDSSGAIRATDPWGLGHAEAEHLHGGENIGLQVNVTGKAIFKPGPRARRDFTENQEQRARAKCVEALFDDLRTACATQRVVLLLDTWEKGNVVLRDFIYNGLLKQHVLHQDKNMRPDKLLVVIAGRRYEPVTEIHGLRTEEFRPLFDTDADYSATVLSRPSLSQWDLEHIRAFLVINGCAKPTKAEVGIIREHLSKGVSLEKIVSLIDEHFLAWRGGEML